MMDIVALAAVIILMALNGDFNPAFPAPEPEREIIPVFKYAFSLLGWSVRDIRDFTTLDILKAFCKEM